MPSGADTTKRNWQASRRLTVLLFTRLRRENPEWDFEDLVRHLDLPPSRLFLELAEEAGFEVGGEPSTAEQNKILKVMLREVFGAKEIARETGLPLAKVERYLREVGVPFGAGGGTDRLRQAGG